MTSESLLSYYSFLLWLFHGAINLIIVSDEINQSIMKVSGVVAFFDNLTMKKHNKRCWYVSFMLLEQIFAQWWHPVASSEALDLLHWEICVVLYRRTATAIKMASMV